MKIAVISDIHGNSWALREVLKGIDRKRPDIIVNLGDSLYGPLRPNETYELIRSYGIISISGNEDRLIVENIDKQYTSRTLPYVIKELSDEAIQWLQLLPADKSTDWGAFLCHGTPQSDITYLVECIQGTSVTVRDAAEIEELLNGIYQKIILCGHSHIPRIIQTPQRTIINPGSVGLNAYNDDHPTFHKIENYHNHAHYCFVEMDGESLQIELVALPYDVRRAAACAAENGRDDWASWLLTGRA